MAISASEARQRLFPLLEQVNADYEPVRITSKVGDAVLMSAETTTHGRKRSTSCVRRKTHATLWNRSPATRCASHSLTRPITPNRAAEGTRATGTHPGTLPCKLRDMTHQGPKCRQRAGARAAPAIVFGDRETGSQIAKSVETHCLLAVCDAGPSPFTLPIAWLTPHRMLRRRLLEGALAG